MIYEQMKKDNIIALKEKNQVKKAVITLVLSKANLYVKENHLETLADQDISVMISKFIKELTEEMEMFEKANRADKVEELGTQINVLKAYLPKQLTEEEIKSIISGLDDKTIPSIMKHFKANYNGAVDMSLVSKVAKTF